MQQSKVLDKETEILQGRKKKRNNFWRPQNTLIHKAILTKENKRLCPLINRITYPSDHGIK